MMRGGKVIHQLGRRLFRAALPSLMNNFGNHIRAAAFGLALSLTIGSS
jgi:hypothetical protein